MLRHMQHRRLLAGAATAAALAATAPAAVARPIGPDDPVGATHTSAPALAPAAPAPVRVVRVQVDQGLDWNDAGVGAAGMLALVLAGYGGAQALTTVRHRARSAAHS
jgi:hypothetical protein